METDTKKPKLNGNIESNIINQHFDTNSDFFKKYSHYHTNTLQSHNKVVTTPFLAGSIGNVFNPKFLKKVRKEIEQKQKYDKRYNDLYEFYQSKDLKSTPLKNLKQLRDSIYGSTFLDFFSKLTGIKLTSKLDVSVSKYIYGNHLLCHDDDIKSEKEGRRIAFIIYLVDEDWDEKDGGALELFSRDQYGQPIFNNTIKLTPKWNQLVFFEIGNYSYHQVSEVLAKTKDRLSIVGWFHGPLDNLKKPLVNYEFTKTIEYKLQLSDFINKDYLNKENIQKINLQFNKDATIELRQFLLPEVYQTSCEELNQIIWHPILGPAHIRKYRKAVEMSKTLSLLKELFQSDQFLQLLNELLNQNLMQYYGELRQFCGGDYTLLHDHALEPEGIDLIFPLIKDLSQVWKSDYGGNLSYVLDGNELFSHLPSNNCLTLIKREKDTYRFLKYLKLFCPFVRTEFAFTYQPEK
ncbi:hypothetical protein K502DRAFT_311885 [Neoconidiobolus thromboides FSU 785]|nr:hypothetical protein K502DRAFT_311885 [Neoconidiobolus thromboides FSU 785]